MSVARWRPPSGRDGPHTLREGRALYLQACQIGYIAAQTVVWCDERGAAGAALRVMPGMICSALFLIAAKPVKSCDRGVFQALNLLSKKE